MKHISIIAGTIVLALSMAVLPAVAATGSITVSSSVQTVVAGQTFTVPVTVNPSGGSVYTVKASIQFPANLLEVTGFSFASGVLPLNQPGYDTTNNTGGVLVKSGGFTGGTATSQVLGTATFRAKAPGTATIVVAGDSAVYDDTSSNVYTGGNQSVVTIQSPATPAPTSTTIAGTVTASPSPSPSPEPEETELAGETTEEDTEDLAAATILGLSGGAWRTIGVIVLLAALAWFFVRRRRGRGPSTQNPGPSM